MAVVVLSSLPPDFRLEGQLPQGGSVILNSFIVRRPGMFPWMCRDRDCGRALSRTMMAVTILFDDGGDEEDDDDGIIDVINLR